MYSLKLIGLLLLALTPIATGTAHAATIAGRVVDPDGKGVAQAVVFVQAPVRSPAPEGTPTAEMIQLNKTFVPGVLPIVAGTRVEFPNRDPIQHHVYSFSRVKTFELPLYRGENTRPVLFDKPGVVKIGCNIHDWMSAIILVLPTPQFAMTDEDGRYTLSGLPPGDYKIAVWHARNRGKTEASERQVSLGASDRVEDFQLSLSAAPARPARHGVRGEQ